MTKNSLSGLALVVDDSSDALSLIHDALEDAGMDVLVALEGNQALKIAERMRPDIILLDGTMPVMDGFETCKQLKAKPDLQAIPVVFMTGLTDTDSIVKGFEAGGVDYLTKPIQAAELVARLKVHLVNARLTRSAYSALDQSGQNLLSVNALGKQNWATPAAVSLLAKAKLDENKNEVAFAEQISFWIRHSPDAEQKLLLEDLPHPLEVKLVSAQPQEWVLKLTDGERLEGAPILKEALNLTERESEVIYWIANGKTNREAAEILQMSPRTVNKHLEQIFQKLDVDNRTSAAGVALKVLAKREMLA